ncbi:MAG: hypothetical protein GKR98_12230 [Boseongicola sp.]|nr:MAG: hypothetical protein GKR98_12230 [Boseongicola sp.]
MEILVLALIILIGSFFGSAISLALGSKKPAPAQFDPRLDARYSNLDSEYENFSALPAPA